MTTRHQPSRRALGWLDSYDPGDPFNGNIQMSLSDYGGQDVKLRWSVITDANDDGGIGAGALHDDVQVFIAGFDNDVGCAEAQRTLPDICVLRRNWMLGELHIMATSIRRWFLLSGA